MSAPPPKRPRVASPPSMPTAAAPPPAPDPSSHPAAPAGQSAPAPTSQAGAHGVPPAPHIPPAPHGPPGPYGTPVGPPLSPALATALDAALVTLSHADLVHLLRTEATRVPGMADRIVVHATALGEARRIQREAEEAAQRHVEAARVVSFDHYSKHIWHQLNTAHRSLSGARQYEASFGVSEAVRETFWRIAESVRPESNAGTKLSALETMRKMGKSIVLSIGQIPAEVRKRIEGEEMEAMLSVCDMLSEEDKTEIVDSGLVGRLEELMELAEEYGVFEELGEVLEIITGEEYS